MDFTKIIAELRSERERINQAIAVFEGMGMGKRRGRPPKWIAESASDVEAVERLSTKRRHFSPEARKRMAEAQRKRWQATREKRAQSK